MISEQLQRWRFLRFSGLSARAEQPLEWEFFSLFSVRVSLLPIKTIASRPFALRTTSLSWYMVCFSAVQWPVWGSCHFVHISFVMGHLKQMQYSRCGLISVEKMGINPCSAGYSCPLVQYADGLLQHTITWLACVQLLVHQQGGIGKRQLRGNYNSLIYLWLHILNTLNLEVG